MRRGTTEAARNRVRDVLEIERPVLRADCVVCPVCQAVRDGSMPDRTCGHTEDEMVRHSRPCLFVACRHSVYLDITSVGSIKLTYPDLEPDELEVSCTLDVSDHGSLTLEEAGELLAVTRERARQLEEKALRTFRAKGGWLG